MKTALLIIDMQNDFFGSERLQSLKDELIEKINSLATIARKKSIPVIWVRQEMKADMSDAPRGIKKAGKPLVVVGTPGAQLLEGLQKEAGDYEVIKTRYSPFYKTELEDLLKKLGIDTLVISGINTHACVRMAAIDGYERDYEIILAVDCANSHDEEHHKISVKYLSSKIAHIMTNAQIQESIDQYEK